MDNNEFTLLLSLDGYKSVAVISLAIIGIYACKKCVDKLYASSVVVNANGSAGSK